MLAAIILTVVLVIALAGVYCQVEAILCDGMPTRIDRRTPAQKRRDRKAEQAELESLMRR
jgi:hypothetical protein